MTKQPEALRLADELDALECMCGSPILEMLAANELRRLHEIKAELLKTLEHFFDANYLAWDAPLNNAE